MKKIVFNTGFLIAALLYISTAIAQNDGKELKYSKSKNYSKSYSVSGSDKISLDNQFGDIKLITWDKNEVKVDVSMTGKANEEDHAQEIVDRMNIEDSKSGGTVSFKTTIGKEKKTRNNTSQTFEINYTVYLPSNNTLKVANQFGDIILPDYRGEVTISSKFGSLKAGKISNPDDVTVEFGKAEIEQLNGGSLTIKFSEGTVNKLSGTVKTSLEFSSVKLVIDNDVKGLTVNNSYSTVYLDVDKGLSATYDISTSHGNFSNKSDFNLKTQGDPHSSYGPVFNYRYTGTSGGGSIKIKASASFGEFILGHNLKVDLSDKKKSKGTKNG